MVKRKKTRLTSTSKDPITAYAKSVHSGKVIAGPDVRGSCERHLKDLKNGHKRGIYFDVEAAERAIGYFRDVLRLNGGEFEGLPFILLPWQAFIVGSLFGWKSDDGTRRFRVSYIETGKGSGKSPLAAGIGLYCMTSDKEPRAEIYAGATKKDQAKVLFRDAVAMVEQSPALLQRLSLSGGDEKTNIADLKQGSFFRPISTESRGKGQSGPRPHVALLDEIHEHPTNAMVEFMRAGTKGRRQALIFMITNSGSDKTSVCWEYHNYASNVCKGNIEDDSFFAYVCGLDEKDDPLNDESCWGKANPSLGITIPIKYLREQVVQAKGMPSKQNIVLRLNFCRWTDADSAWITKEVWEAVEKDNLKLSDYKGRKCFGAIDLSQATDFTALALIFPNEDKSVDMFVEFWSPGDTLKSRSEKDGMMDHYLHWRDEGHLNAPPGKVIKLGFVAKRLAEIASDFDLQALGYDRWRIETLRDALEDIGLDIPLVEVGQGFKDMSPAIEKLEEYILDQSINIKTNPLLRWNVASVVIEEDPAGNRKFTKRKATGRIDGIVAGAMAAKVSNDNVAEESSPWDDPDFKLGNNQ